MFEDQTSQRYLAILWSNSSFSVPPCRRCNELIVQYSLTAVSAVKKETVYDFVIDARRQRIKILIFALTLGIDLAMMFLKRRWPYAFPIKECLDCDGVDPEAWGNQLRRFAANRGVRYPCVSSVFLIHGWKHPVKTLVERFHRNEQSSGEFIGLALEFVFAPVVFIQPVDPVSGCSLLLKVHGEEKGDPIHERWQNAGGSAGNRESRRSDQKPLHRCDQGL